MEYPWRSHRPSSTPLSIQIAEKISQEQKESSKLLRRINFVYTNMIDKIIELFKRKSLWLLNSFLGKKIQGKIKYQKQKKKEKPSNKGANKKLTTSVYICIPSCNHGTLSDYQSIDRGLKK